MGHPNVGDTKQRRHQTNFDLDINPSSQRPCAEIFETASPEPIMQSIVDWFDQTDDWLWKLSRWPIMNQRDSPADTHDAAIEAAERREGNEDRHDVRGRPIYTQRERLQTQTLSHR